jgi:DNA-binding NtrC family response regulator
MTPVIWVCSSRPLVRDRFASTRLEAKLEFLPGLIALTRREGVPDMVCIDGTEHDLLLSDIVIKTLLRAPTADLVVLLDDADDPQAAGLAERGADLVIGPPDEWVPDLRRRLESRARLAGLGWVGKSEALHRLADQVLQVAPSDIAVLITGASGTGKELVARALHDFSSRRARPFIPLNTGAIPETLLESELFGHEKGAFTGAVTRHEGIFEAARGGTVFLDEIGDMPAATQVKLLRVLESRRFRRLGGTVEIDADVRVVSATHRNLAELEEGGAFRHDLYYRISAVTISATRLSERRADLLPLLIHFWQSHAGPRPAPTGIDAEGLRLVWNYPWPGNVRELRNFADSASVAAPGRQVTRELVLDYVQRQRGDMPTLPVRTERRPPGSESEVLLHAVLHLGQQVRELRRLVEERLPAPVAEESMALRAPSTSMADAERRAIETALFETGGNRREAARRLGIGERTLYRKIKAYGLP